MRPSIRAIGLTALALLAFAANSVLTRAALDLTGIDPISFTAVRLVSGALLLLVLVRARIERSDSRGGWTPALALFGYALCFSLAYRGLTAATGALLLFGAVQVTMLAAAAARGERLTGRQRLGSFTALGGLLLLLWPGLAAPPAAEAGLMLIAGVAWGIYTLRASGPGNPTARTAANFLRASVPALGLLAVWATQARWDPHGVLLAVASGALASGLGYAIWYAALRRIDTHTAAVAQLAVPVLTAGGGVLLLAEPLSARLLGAGTLVLIGIGLVVRGRSTASSPGR
ncbi:DMT family transporter [Wenzhouxiangella sp. XN79A]|uniref:DMT family transporter n=1 Tax=Wenzhouxiangella sp. XN79A TaxID=2724193 RepID=UPI00144AA93A|nr:DMT family transporter [Wenzhouxiangella sp. XN79A]NKI36398.1 DMT family transporter [Wenzhouxiangella sp. XN79A]